MPIPSCCQQRCYEQKHKLLQLFSATHDWYISHVILACARGLDWHRAILRSKKHKGILTEPCCPLQFLPRRWLVVLSWNSRFKVCAHKRCLHRRLPLKIFWYSVNGPKKSINLKFLHQSMHKNCPHVKVCASAPWGSVMFSAKGITAFEQLTWEQRPSQGRFILNPFNSYWEHQSSDKTHAASSPTSVWGSDVVPLCAPGVQGCGPTDPSHPSWRGTGGQSICLWQNLTEHASPFMAAVLNQDWFPLKVSGNPHYGRQPEIKPECPLEKKWIVISLSSQCWWLTVQDNGRTPIIFSPRKLIFCMLILYLNIYPNPSIHVSALGNHQPISNVSFVQKR